MSLPMDISTALWWRSVPVWDWEALPPVPAAGDAAAAPDDTPPSSAPCGAAAPEASPAPAARPGIERDGYRLVFKGYEISASVFWYPADSPLSRPWLRHDEPAADRRPRSDGDEAVARAESQQRAAAAGEGEGDGIDGDRGPA